MDAYLNLQKSNELIRNHNSDLVMYRTTSSTICYKNKLIFHGRKPCDCETVDVRVNSLLQANFNFEHHKIRAYTLIHHNLG